MTLVLHLWVLLPLALGRRHLGCGFNDVPGKLGLGDTAWSGTVQPLQGEFCETGVLICFKSNGTRLGAVEPLQGEFCVAGVLICSGFDRA